MVMSRVSAYAEVTHAHIQRQGSQYAWIIENSGGAFTGSPAKSGQKAGVKFGNKNKTCFQPTQILFHNCLFKIERWKVPVVRG